MSQHKVITHSVASQSNSNNNNNNEIPKVIIGIEIHCQMTSLNSKLFCPCKSDYRKMRPNQNICPICTGLPGTLPLLNKKAIHKAMMIAMALKCAIPDRISFFRKNYFYPDLPKNFQITQLNMNGDISIGNRGKISVDGKEIRIRRIQIEEDPGRLIYEGASSKNTITLVDYNRAGTALVEIVTEPDFESPRQVRLFLHMLSDMLKNLEVSDPTLEGAMRADANVSLAGNNRVEIKNISSFHDLEKAVIFEIARQEAQYSRGHDIIQETRHWDASRKITTPARRKEEDMDYRYLPEADIPWIEIDADTINSLKEKMPESISEKLARYTQEYGMAPQVAKVLSSDKLYSDLFDAARSNTNAKELANIITTDLIGMIEAQRRKKIDGLDDFGGDEMVDKAGGDDGEMVDKAGGDDGEMVDKAGDGDDGMNYEDEMSNNIPITPPNLQKLADAVTTGEIARNSAKQILYDMIKTKKSFEDTITNMETGKITGSTELENIVKQVIAQETEAVKQAATNPNTINYLVGKIMQKTRGRADPQITMKILKEQIQKK